MLNKNLNRTVENASLEDKLDRRILKNIDYTHNFVPSMLQQIEKENEY